MTIHHHDDRVTLHHGDCLDVLRSLPDASVDSIVTDPPYGLEFMGKEWDSFKGEAWRNSAGITGTGYTDGGNRLSRPSYGGSDGANPTCATCGGRKRGAKKCACDSPEWRVKGKPLGERDNNAAQMRAFGEWCELWATECLRVLRPGGHLLAFGGTRTWHRLACAVEDAGFEVRDSIAWLYGSGFPKSLDVSKAIDKAAGAERAVVGSKIGQPGYHLVPGERGGEALGQGLNGHSVEERLAASQITAPATPDAERWQGWGTALKPAFEPVVVARKPLIGTVAANVLTWGTGALNVDDCRIEGDVPSVPNPILRGTSGHYGSSDGRNGQMSTAPAGRWPANVVLDEDMAQVLDTQSGASRSPSGPVRQGGVDGYDPGENGGTKPRNGFGIGYGDTGGASRFFYVAKAPKRERPRVDDVAHPTVKPLALMRWLVRLVTPPGGTVLEPFAGSGTTVEACLLEDFRCVAIEREADYLPLILARIERQNDDRIADEVTRPRADAEVAIHEQMTPFTLFDELGEATA